MTADDEQHTAAYMGRAISSPYMNTPRTFLARRHFNSQLMHEFTIPALPQLAQILAARPTSMIFIY